MEVGWRYMWIGPLHGTHCSRQRMAHGTPARRPPPYSPDPPHQLWQDLVLDDSLCQVVTVVRQSSQR